MNEEKRNVQLALLQNIISEKTVLNEVEDLFEKNYGSKDFSLIEKAFEDVVDLFKGNFENYKACNTEYHDLNHTLEALLAYSRILYGYNIKKEKIPADRAVIGLIAVLLHDTGYIQKEDDKEGTGAKYTANHVQRSIDFMKEYFKKAGLSDKDFKYAAAIVECTGVNVSLEKVEFSDDYDRVLGYMLGTADLIGQMSSRTYLEKLVCLYREFNEAGIGGYESEYDLLKKTITFYNQIVKPRLEKEFDGVYKYAAYYFSDVHGIESNLYMETIEKQLEYLDVVLKTSPDSFKENFRRSINPSDKS